MVEDERRPRRSERDEVRETGERGLLAERKRSGGGGSGTSAGSGQDMVVGGERDGNGLIVSEQIGEESGWMPCVAR